MTFDGSLLGVTGQGVSRIYDIGLTSGAVSINWNNGNTQKLTLTGGGGSTFSYSNAVAGGVYSLVVTLGLTNSGLTFSWPSNTKWPAGATGSFSQTQNAVDVLSVVALGSSGNYLTVLNKDFK